MRKKSLIDIIIQDESKTLDQKISFFTKRVDECIEFLNEDDFKDTDRETALTIKKLNEKIIYSLVKWRRKCNK